MCQMYTFLHVEYRILTLCHNNKLDKTDVLVGGATVFIFHVRLSYFMKLSMHIIIINIILKFCLYYFSYYLIVFKIFTFFNEH